MEVNNEILQRDYLVSSVKNALRILNSFSIEEPEKKITDLSKSLGLGKSTISRLMMTLASEGFVVKDPESQKYRLGISLLSLSNVVTHHLEIHRESLPVLENIVAKINETAHISILEGSKVCYLNTVPSNHKVRYFTHVGESNPAYCTSSGKVILAYQDDETVNRILSEGLTAHTPYTITDIHQFKEHLAQIRKNGFSISNQELIEGVIGIAAPIRNHRGKVFAAVSVVGPQQRMTEQKIPLYAEQVKHAAKEISRRLGYSSASQARQSM